MESHPSFQCADPALQKLFSLAQKRCRENLKDFAGRPVLVEGGGYSKIWLETQPMGGAMYALYDPQVAYNNVFLFMEHQRADGRLPGSIQLANGHMEAQFNKLQGFCFPYPAMQVLSLRGNLPSERAALMECLIRFDGYLWRTRNTCHDNILESFCVYDTGEDKCVRYGNVPVWWEADTPPEGYDRVPMGSQEIMSWSYAARKTIAWILQSGGKAEAAEAWEQKALEVRHALCSRLWNDDDAMLYDLDARNQPIRMHTHLPLRCMYFGALPRHVADAFVRRQLLRPDAFWTTLPLPSLSVSDPAFQNAPENNWSGQVEGLTLQRAIHALENYGYESIVTALGRRLLTALIKGDYLFPQQFDPLTGAPSRVGMLSHEPIPEGSTEPVQDAYGPTLLAALEYIAHIYGIAYERGEIWFSLGSGLEYAYTVPIGSRQYAIRSDGQHADIAVDHHVIGRFPCGTRIRTDAEGRILGKRPLEGPLC
ncbi:MAG: hypothetical protein IJ246_13085 [Clostridia bacterium]|nr:hypothetical protein [Clostridia bacterium]